MRYKYKYQSGGYIPGISQSLYGMGLQRDAIQAQKDFEEEAKRVAKEQKKRGIFSKVLGQGGKWAGKAIGSIFGQGTIGGAVGEGLGTAIGGSYAGKKYDAGDIKKSKTGLFGEDFDELERINEAGDKSFMDYLKGSAGNVGSLISDKYLDPSAIGGKIGDFIGKNVSPGFMNKIRGAGNPLQGFQPAKIAEARAYTPWSKLSNTGLSSFQIGGDVNVWESFDEGGEEELGTDTGNRIVSQLLPDIKPSYPTLNKIMELEKELAPSKAMSLRTDFDAMDERASRATKRSDLLERMGKERRDLSREDKLTAMLDKERLPGLDDNVIDDLDILPDEALGEMPSLYDNETEMAYQQSLPSSTSMGQDNELLSMAQDSLSMQKQMEDLSHNLGRTISSYMGENRPQQLIRRGGMSDGLYDTQVQSPYFRLPMNQEGGLLNYQEGGMMGEYKGGGLLDVMPFARRIV